MTQSKVVVLPAGYRLDVTSNSVASGYYHIKGNPGEADGSLTSIGANASIVIGPFNINRMYRIVTETGTINHVTVFEYVQDDASTLGELNDVVFTDVLEDDVLAYDGTNWVNRFALPGSGIDSVLQDTSPQLGGDLDRNGFNIIGMVIGTDIQAYNAALDNVSGTNTGDQDLSGYFLSSNVIDEDDMISNSDSDVPTQQSTKAYVDNAISSIEISEIDDIGDVNIVAPDYGQVLTYNNGVWSNEDPVGGGSGLTAAQTMSLIMIFGDN